MNWTNIKLIASREIRDQLRDRRTIFVIAILPLLLYPLLGMSFLQIAQFMRESPAKVWIIGAELLPDEPTFLDGDAFRSDLLSQPANRQLFEISTGTLPADRDVKQTADAAISSGACDAVIHITPQFAREIQRLDANFDGEFQRINTEDAKQLATSSTSDSEANVSGPDVYFNVAKDRSRIAHDRVAVVLSRWRNEVLDRTKTPTERPKKSVKPLTMVGHDLSAETGRGSALWSKLLPFIVLIWAMTGAFYPAIDLCAGEKERGTLETLLSSPASRNDIVAGKLITVTVFSIATSLLNLTSMGVTSNFVTSQLQSINGLSGINFAAPPVTTLAWLVLALIPIAALFSALSLALAAMARSTKEGQYYLMPLMLGTLPLMMLPMMPGVELDLGNSLIPVAGVVLLLRSLIDGNVAMALQYLLPVLGVTAICCWLAMLWAIHQFQDERVLFHESEQFSLKSWLIHIIRDRGEIPTVAQAFLCAVLLLIVRFFGQFLLPIAMNWQSLFLQTATLQIALIAGPAVLMALLLTRRPAKTLLLQRPSEGSSSLFLAALLALAMHPVVSTFSNGIRALYPISDQTLAKLDAMQGLLSDAPSLSTLLILVALLPAVCEELAFRGFILSGLSRMRNKWLAILVSSLFFGIAHQLLQQSITAFAVGMLIGFVAIKTKSIFPCMLYHLIHNSLPLLVAHNVGEGSGVPELVEVRGDALVYGGPFVILCFAAVMLLVQRFHNNGSSSPTERPGLEPRAFGV